MVLEFRVENAYSFYEPQTLSFEATSNKDYEDYLIYKIGKERILRLACIYGANASGKSNLLKALNDFRRFAFSKKNKQEPIDAYKPFRFHAEAKQQPCRYRLVFFAPSVQELKLRDFSQAKRYVYELSFDAQHILSEKLEYYPKSQPALLYERNYDSETGQTHILFGAKSGLNKQEQDAVRPHCPSNRTLLNALQYIDANSPSLAAAYAWFKDYFMSPFDPKTQLAPWASAEIEDKNNKGITEFVLEILRRADFNIEGLEFRDKKLSELSEREREALQKRMNLGTLEKQSLRELLFLHKTEMGLQEMPFALQSLGTQRYYSLAVILYKLLRERHILAIDELENSLHPELTAHFLQSFALAANASQLFFTTHNKELLRLEYMRHDMVYLTEKGADASSELFSAADFSLHKNSSLYNFYSIGKLGGKPSTTMFVDEG